MYWAEVDREEFYTTIRSISYRADDIREADQFGANSIEICYNKAKHRFAKYFVVYEDDGTPRCTVMLERCGGIVFFISDTINNNIALIRTLRDLADTKVSEAGPIVTRTASWYTEAIRINRLIGFKVFKLEDYSAYYVKE
jgi:hypothetical protein